MTYLNDVPKGGTEFFYQKITSLTNNGLTNMSVEFTHLHKGQIAKQENI